MAFAAAVVVLLPFVYIAFLAAMGWLLIWQGDRGMEDYALNRGPAWMAITRLVLVGFGAVLWVMMFRPLLTRRPRRPASLELMQANHGDLFQLLAAFHRSTRCVMPAEVRVDCSMGARAVLKHGLFSLLSQRTVLTFGLPLAASATAREFAGALANQLGRQPRGLLLGRLSHVVRIMNDWLSWVALRLDPWEAALAAAGGKKQKKIPLWKKMLRALPWITQRPIWLIMWIGRAVSARPLRMMVHNGDLAESQIVGSAGFAESLQRQPHWQAAWEKACASVQEALHTQRLADNFPQTVARHATSTQATPEAVQAWQSGSIFCPTAERRIARMQKLALAGGFAVPGNGAAFVRDFNDLSRQATQVHYQHDLRLTITQFRLVAADEVVSQRRKADDALGAVRRYFQGLAHPERGLCSDGPAGAIVPEPQAFRVAIRDGRHWLRSRGDQMRATLREWQMSWQRIRDLEMAHAYALAGLPVDSHQYGVASHTPELYREEIERQKLICEVSEDPLLADEARLETRFAAALGLLWDTPASQLPDALAQIRARVPAQAILYQTLVDRLPALRGLITFASAFESLGAKFNGAQSGGNLLPANRFLVPRLMLHIRQLISGLEQIPCPEEAGGGQLSIASHLLGQLSPGAHALLAADWEKAPPAIGNEEAAFAAELVAPVMDRFTELYHRTYSALASAAETSEMQLLGGDEEEPSGQPASQQMPQAMPVMTGMPALA